MVDHDWTNGLRIERTSTPVQVAATLRRRILEGELKPGTRICEASLAQSLDVSRNTVREGVRLLVAEGLLRHSFHKGMAVATIDARDVVEIYRARRLLELTAVKSSKRPSSDRLDALHRAMSTLREAELAGDGNGMRDGNAAFHGAIVGFLDNERLTKFAVSLMRELRLAHGLLDQSDTEYPARWTEQHRQILESIEAAEPGRAAKLLAEHLDESEARLTAGISAILRGQ